MAEVPTKKWVGVVALVIGALTAMMLFFELKDGALQGSRSNGMTVSSNPITFYVSVTLEFLVMALLLFAGISILRRKS